jgi:uncharacterized protein involved in response to NO
MSTAGHAGYQGPPLLGRGLRPFFLLAGLYAVLSLLLWLGVLAGHCSIPTAFDPVAWHAHEMLFGFALAAIAGFVLTAVPHWTGRPVLSGAPLGLLVLLWLAGRFAVAFSGVVGPMAAAAVDLLFPVALMTLVANDILRARHWHGLLLVAVLGVFLLANLLTHLAAAAEWWQFGDIGRRLGLGVLVMLISLIGGRVIPNFTGNWLQVRGERRPPLLGLTDRLALIATAIGLLSWTVQPESVVSASLLALAALVQAARLTRWRGHRTLAEPLVWSLHLAYLWVPIGLGLLALGVLAPDAVPAAAGVHALAAGAIGGMILAMTTRATLGHTGRTLNADRWTLIIYLLICSGAAARVASALVPAAYLALLGTAGVLWLIAFGMFVLRYGPMLVTARVDGRAP